MLRSREIEHELKGSEGNKPIYIKPASVMSKFPLSPSSAGTRIKSSVISSKTLNSFWVYESSCYSRETMTKMMKLEKLSLMSPAM